MWSQRLAGSDGANGRLSPKLEHAPFLSLKGVKLLLKSYLVPDVEQVLSWLRLVEYMAFSQMQLDGIEAAGTRARKPQKKIDTVCLGNGSNVLHWWFAMHRTGRLEYLEH